MTAENLATPAPPSFPPPPQAGPRWLPYTLPYLIYLVGTQFEPYATAAADAQRSSWLAPEHYPYVYTVKVVLTLLAVVWAWPTLKQFPLRVSWLAPVVGAIGVVLWIGITHLQLEPKLLQMFGGKATELGARAAYNPLESLAETPIWRAVFIAIRFTGLAIAVPIAEEFFFRGLIMRMVSRPDWWSLPIGVVTPMGLAVGTLLPALSHPELLAAVVWFSLVSWLMLRTRNIWDCVVAHSVTNLLLGLYVIFSGDWQLW